MTASCAETTRQEAMRDSMPGRVNMITRRYAATSVEAINADGIASSLASPYGETRRRRRYEENSAT